MLDLKVAEVPFTKQVYDDGRFSHTVTGVFVVVASDKKAAPEGMNNVIWAKWVPGTWGQRWHPRPFFGYRRRRALKKAYKILNKGTKWNQTNVQSTNTPSSSKNSATSPANSGSTSTAQQ